MPCCGAQEIAKFEKNEEREISGTGFQPVEVQMTGWKPIPLIDHARLSVFQAPTNAKPEPLHGHLPPFVMCDRKQPLGNPREKVSKTP